ncbi:restriction modification system DNA specificity domain protein [Methanocaldococcus vulcanius M7]|uniref:Restriction modification system DNA specificity domain protein n=1 Tax=Methanocaldococcus vulcanius (strain ATCC 700851 / DSM 12094 / M7) TaxID=579137 RepID=C9RGU5_METVM|nr:restriction endonuclease subunit S [Methanocaldococcus vulcanius]ACX72797.1 restriction modification system DNA specificity domain protein [Methanocaldococcus vulcanius M7]
MVKFRWETEFKETEIGKIPKDWNVKRLGDLCVITSSKRIYLREYTSEGIPFYRAKEIISLSQGEQVKNCLYISNEKYEEIKAKYGVPKEGDLLLTAIGTIGYVYMVKQNDKFYFKDGNVLWLKDFKNLYQKYLYFLLPVILKHQEIYIGSSQKALTIKDLKEVEIPYPPPEEQQKIATVLSYFDDLIENKKKQNETLEKIALELFKNWFIDFEPFKDEEFVYNEELDKEIPKGWEVKRLGEIAELIKGVSYKSSEISKEPEENIFITLNNFLRGGGFKTEYIYYKGTKAKETQKIKEGDLIIALTDMTAEAKVVGAPAIVILPNNCEFGIISLDCAKIDLKDEFLKYYLYLYLKYSQEENSTFANGVNVLHLKVELFKNSKFILIPPQPILQKFHSLVQPLFEKIINNQKQIMVLKKIRDALLPKLVFGELRVEEL